LQVLGPEDPGDHRGGEDEDVRRAGAECGQGATRAEARDAPADAEDRRAADQARVEIARGRQVEPALEDRALAAEDEAVADGGHDQRAAHDEGEGGVPGARDVEEVDDLGRVRHAREHDACAEDHADQVDDEKTHGFSLR
jgi:hypothetical protein